MSDSFLSPELQRPFLGCPLYVGYQMYDGNFESGHVPWARTT
jgi:hypothetical protein